MKKMIAVFLVGCVLFSLSAGVSWFLQKQQKPAESEESASVATLKPGKGIKPFAATHTETAPPAKGSLRPALRTAASAETENIAQMASSLRNQIEAVKTREQQLSVRQRNLELIHLDMRKEREAVSDLQKQVGEEMKALLDRMSALETKSAQVTKERNKVSEQVEEAKKSIIEFETVEQKSIKQMATIYDTMEAESAAQILTQMVDSGKMDMAVKILASMRERQAAKVLSLLQDRTMAVQILDKLKGLKRPAANTQ
jgi:flagellar motility protein MotE (MotC chaperone)